jgi:hypothetical protein
MRFAVRLYLTIFMFSSVVNNSAFAQEVVNMGAVRVVFPTLDWQKSEPPATVLEAAPMISVLKLLYAESVPSSLIAVVIGALSATIRLAARIRIAKKVRF